MKYFLIVLLLIICIDYYTKPKIYEQKFSYGSVSEQKIIIENGGGGSNLVVHEDDLK